MKNDQQNTIYRTFAILIIVICLLTIGLKIFVTSKISLGADYFTFWQAGKALFLRGISPYDPSTTSLIQQGIYGRLAHAGEDQLRYAYPPFSLLVILPEVRMSYPWAEASWMAFSCVLIFAAVYLVVKRPSLGLIAGLVFFYPVSRSIILGQFSLMVGAILVIIYGLLKMQGTPSNGRQWLAGVLIAWCLMKPQLSGLIILFFLLEILHKHEWRVLLGLMLGGIGLAAISWVLVPTWVVDWVKEIFSYMAYVSIQPIIGSWLAIFGLSLSNLWLKIGLLGLSVLISLGLILAWWKGRIADYLLLGWLVLLSQLVNPNSNSLLSDQIIFFLPLLLWLNIDSIKSWVRGITWGVFVILPWVLFVVYFHGKEPYAVASGLALLFTIWLTGTGIAHVIQVKLSSTTSIGVKRGLSN